MNPVEAALNELHDALTHFVNLLKAESDSLRDLHAETLSDVVKEKSQWAELANTAWNRLVIAAGVGPGRGRTLEGAMSAFPQLQVKWLDIKRLAGQAGHLNESNSVLIEAQMRRTRQALDVLQSASNRGALYGANGLMVDNIQTQHTLDKI